MSSERQDYAFLISQDMGASFVSSELFVVADERFSLQLVYTGSPVGTLVLQFSNDNINWATADDSSGDTREAVTSAGNTMYIIADNGVRYCRVKYTRTSGSGTIDGIAHFNDDRG